MLSEILKKLSLIKIEEDDEGIEYGISIHRTLQKDAKQFLEIKDKKVKDSLEDIIYNKE